ncbi:MAG: hypothetical protein VW891_01970, partial [Novosphingobium sp.]
AQTPWAAADPCLHTKSRRQSIDPHPTRQIRKPACHRIWPPPVVLVNSPGSNIPGVPFLHCTHPRRVLSQHRGKSRDGRYETLQLVLTIALRRTKTKVFAAIAWPEKSLCAFHFPTTQGHSFAHPQISLKAPFGWLRCRLDVFASVQVFLENQSLDRQFSGRFRYRHRKAAPQS